STRGTGNAGWHRLIPATAECRKLVNAARREAFARCIDAPRKVADRIFSEARGYEPALQTAAEVWPLLSKCPTMSNKALREAGFRPGHTHEGTGIAAVRAALGVWECIAKVLHNRRFICIQIRLLSTLFAGRETPLGPNTVARRPQSGKP